MTSSMGELTTLTYTGNSLKNPAKTGFSPLHNSLFVFTPTPAHVPSSLLIGIKTYKKPKQI